MPITSDSFRDPRRLVTVKAISGFFLDDKPVEIGDVVQLPRSKAHELIGANKVIRVVEPPAAPKPFELPAPDAPPAASENVKPSLPPKGKQESKS